ncbi:MAG: peptidoglycan-binding domain-containing protein, partial [Ferrovibrio sp.]
MTLLPPDPRQTPPERAWPGSPSGNLFRLTGAVGPEAANSRDDIIRAQILLGHAGDLDLDALGGPTGWPGGELTRGLRRYQRRKGLTVDGLMLPDGETINALQDDLYDRLARYKAPTTAEVDDHHDRLARYRPGERDALPQTALRMPGEDAPAYVQRQGVSISDVDDSVAPAFTSGAQVAQALPVINPAMTAPAAGAAGQSPPVTARAGDTLEKFVGDRINLLTL